MARITISLSDDRHRAVKEAAARQGKTIGELIEESLEFYGVKTTKRAAALVAKARKSASLTDEEAQKLAAAETEEERRN